VFFDGHQPPGTLAEEHWCQNPYGVDKTPLPAVGLEIGSGLPERPSSSIVAWLSGDKSGRIGRNS
jgi:hypothetical protein